MVIYLTTNLINGKKYIGKDINNRPGYLGSGIYIKQAIQKYGKENFKKEILCECYDYSILNELESFFIYLLSATDENIGYNMTFGGDGGPITLNHPNKFEIYEKIKKANSGKKYFTKRMTEEEYNDYIKNKQNKTGGDNHYSKKLSPEEYEKYIQRMRDISSGQNSPRAKKIKVTSPNGEIMEFFGDFKKKIEKIKPGLYNYLLSMLHNNKNKSYFENSKHKGWIAEYV